MPRPISHQQGRINLGDLKLQIAKQLGPDRTQMYFGCLTKLLAQKLTKAEFNKFCLLILGRENIPLHNKLIRSILKNAYGAKTPPPVAEKIALNQTGGFPKKSLHGNDPLSQLQAKKPPLHSQCNGNILPPAPLKKRIQKSPLGTNGRVDENTQQSLVTSDKIPIKENGMLGRCNWKRPLQHYFAEQPTKVPRKENLSLHHQIALHRMGLVEAAAMEDKEKLKKSNVLNSTRRSIRAPLGVPLRPPSVGRTRRSLLSGSSSTCVGSNYDNGELCHTEVLRKLMEKVAKAQGIGVTLDCANLLNNALDTYLKRLIKPTVEIARVRSTHEPTKHPVFKQQVNGRLFNGIWAGNHMHVQNIESFNVNNGHRNQYMVSLRDFQAAMELNPQQLGENWPLLLEKICIRSYEE